MNQFKEMIKLVRLWIIGMFAVFTGMVLLFYGTTFSWWPAFLNQPGVCMTWIGIIILGFDKVRSTPEEAG